MTNKIGSIAWVDLTVPEAEGLRDFYCQVTGWESEGVDMKGYQDFCVKPPESDAPIAGICHARGGNADMPRQWLIYITVEDVDASAKRCEALGGKVLVAPKSMGANRYCVIQDPAGAVAALYENNA